MKGNKFTHPVGDTGRSSQHTWVFQAPWWWWRRLPTWEPWGCPQAFCQNDGQSSPWARWTCRQCEQCGNQARGRNPGRSGQGGSGWWPADIEIRREVTNQHVSIRCPPVSKDRIWIYCSGSSLHSTKLHWSEVDAVAWLSSNDVNNVLSVKFNLGSRCFRRLGIMPDEL